MVLPLNPCSDAEVIVLTHERATAEEAVPYLEWLFWPLPIVNLYGRAAVLDPPVRKEEAVWYGWKDGACSAFADHVLFPSTTAC